nr:MAG TPA: hypothetical protein [Caudoviricetes sp.]
MAGICPDKVYFVQVSFFQQPDDGIDIALAFQIGVALGCVFRIHSGASP